MDICFERRSFENRLRIFRWLRWQIVIPMDLSILFESFLILGGRAKSMDFFL